MKSEYVHEHILVFIKWKCNRRPNTPLFFLGVLSQKHNLKKLIFSIIAVMICKILPFKSLLVNLKIIFLHYI